MSIPRTLKLERAAIRALRSAARLLRPPTVYVSERTAEYRAYWEDAAQRLAAEFVPLTGGVWEVRLDGRRTRIANYIVELDSSVTNTLAGDKAYGYGLARECDVPCPRHRLFTLDDLARAEQFVRTLEGPFVVKPSRGSSSAIGVTTHVRTRGQLRRAACLASLFCDHLLVEEMLFGESCRLLYLDGQLLHAVRRRGLRVTGDGQRPLRELIAARSRRLLQDPTTRLTLHRQKLDLDSVPASGHEVLARSLPADERLRSELRTVYDETITSQLGPELVDAGARMAAALGSRFSGVDFVTPDPMRPLADCAGAFIEINTTPGIHHHYVGAGEDLPVAVPVLRRLLGMDPDRRSRDE